MKESMLAAAVKAEQTGDWDAALLRYEDIYDSTPNTVNELVALRHKFQELRPRVLPNNDPREAGVYKARVYVFRSLRVGDVSNTYSDAQIQDVKRASGRWADELQGASLGNVRVEWDCRVIDEPLTTFTGFPDPDSCIPHLTDLKPGQMDFVAVYVLPHGLARNCWADTWGRVCKGAMYGGFNDGGDGVTCGDGEVQVHEWMHALEMTLVWYQLYPPDRVPNPDSGKGNCGPGCWKPEQGKGGLYDWYRHILAHHMTRRMWRNLSVTRKVDSPWVDRLGLCPEFLTLGSFEAAGSDRDGLIFPFVDEATMSPAAGKEAGGKVWQPAARLGSCLDLGGLYYPSEHRVAYAATLVRSPKEQPAQVRVGTDDLCRLWQDGRLILQETKDHFFAVDQKCVPTRLRKGDNLFLLKVATKRHEWHATLRLTDTDGNPLPDITYALPG